MDLNTADQALAVARQQGDSAQLAEALLVHANALAETLQLSQAQQDIEEAATIHRQLGRTEDEARCYHLTATLCRLQGNLADAQCYATQSRNLAPANREIALAAIAELGEIALIQENAALATDAFTYAIAEASTLRPASVTQATLLQKRAIAWVIYNHPQEAIQDASAAAQLLFQLGESGTALRVLIEVATALQQRQELEAANYLSQQAMAAAEQARDYSALADLCLLEATQAIAARDSIKAMSAAQAARNHALAAIAPLPYSSAAVAISKIAEGLGDHLAAYEALAVGWVTVSDLLGREVARSIFEPALLELRNRWGVEMFKEVKLTYETHRRAKRERDSV